MYRYVSSELGFRTPALINSIKIFVRDFSDVPSISVSRLNTEEISQALEIHSLSWQQSKDSTKLIKEFTFTNFKQTFVFMGSVSQVADQMQHFPKWVQKGNKVTVEMTTQDCRGISVKDILLAYTMESIANDVENQTVENVCDTIKVSTNQLLNNWNSNFTKTEELFQGFQKNIVQL
ncbi:unnamed protein product [Paramecium octaurelia]|uniref:4-alpha-hydroxy-tetrahydropterin dehydratase n=1 Tax=Paramecium octaurelia TaxID=43137 RepID=A0A8S1TYI1_PAROT|nr:unnamed protein product [Paramecium octaurelia]